MLVILSHFYILSNSGPFQFFFNINCFSNLYKKHIERFLIFKTCLSCVIKLKWLRFKFKCDLSNTASEETRKNSTINMPSIHQSLDVQNTNKVDQNYCIPNNRNRTTDNWRIEKNNKKKKGTLSTIVLVCFQPNNGMILTG